MMSLFTKIGQYLLIASIFINGILVYQVYTLPKQIAKAINPDAQQFKKDTVLKTVTASLETKNDFVYFSGSVIADPFKVGDHYSYNPNNPNEFYEGYFYLAESNKGGKYFIWKQSDDIKKGFSIDGWFVCINNGKWQSGKEYISVLVPIMKRNQVAMLNK